MTSWHGPLHKIGKSQQHTPWSRMLLRGDGGRCFLLTLGTTFELGGKPGETKGGHGRVVSVLLMHSD